MNWTRAALSVSLVAFVSGVSVGFFRGRDAEDAHVAVSPTGGVLTDDLIQYRARDAREAITEPVFVTAAEARLADGTRVIGIAIGGEAHALPLFVLNQHQVVNDVVGGQPVVASW